MNTKVGEIVLRLRAIRPGDGGEGVGAGIFLLDNETREDVEIGYINYFFPIFIESFKFCALHVGLAKDALRFIFKVP